MRIGFKELFKIGFIIIILFASIIFLYGEEGKIVGNAIYKNNIFEDYGGNVYDEFPNVSDLHWNHMPVTYSYLDKENIYPLRIERIEKALDEVERLTNNAIKFEEVSEGGDISFIGTKTSNINYEGEGYYNEKLGWAEYFINDNFIISANISLYGGMEKECKDYPRVEIHEILHTFGIEHSKNAGSIMSPIAHYCLDEPNMDVDGEMFEKLIEIYN